MRAVLVAVQVAHQHLHTRVVTTAATCMLPVPCYLCSHMVKPGELASHSDFHLFKMGIKPMWEDEANKFGGKWIVRLRKGGRKIRAAAGLPTYFSNSWIYMVRPETGVFRSCEPVLGELGAGHAGRAVYGGGGDLRGRRQHQVPGGNSQHLEPDSLRSSITDIYIMV